MKVQQIFPLCLNPRAANVTAQVLARPRVTLDVIIAISDPDSMDGAERVLGDLFTLQRKHRIQIGEQPTTLPGSVLGVQGPAFHSSAPGAYFRSKRACNFCALRSSSASKGASSRRVSRSGAAK